MLCKTGGLCVNFLESTPLPPNSLVKAHVRSWGVYAMVGKEEPFPICLVQDSGSVTDYLKRKSPQPGQKDRATGAQGSHSQGRSGWQEQVNSPLLCLGRHFPALSTSHMLSAYRRPPKVAENNG